MVIRREAIDGHYEDSWQGFIAQLPVDRVDDDGEIASFALEDEDDVAAFVAALTEGGLCHLDEQSGVAVDFVVIDSLRGPMRPCAWLEFSSAACGDTPVATAVYRRT